MTVLAAAPKYKERTLADKLARLGDIPPDRVRLYPAPGTATEADLLAAMRSDGTLYELVDGTLVEKAMGYRESCLAGAILALLRAFVIPRRLGKVSGPDGMLRLYAGLVRGPDVAFTSWGRFPNRRVSRAAIPSIVPDLAVEVLSRSNTPAEMMRKRTEYLRAGVKLIWIVDPDARTVHVFAPRRKPAVVKESGVLDGGKVLPGFVLELADLFVEFDDDANA